MSKILYLYGNYNLQNSRFQVDTDDFRGASGYSIQRSQIARGIGSVPIAKTTQEKTININGGITLMNRINGNFVDDPNIIQAADQLNTIFLNDKQYFRVIPSYKVISNPTSTAGWSIDADSTNLALDKERFEFDRSSLRFTINTAASSHSFAGITNSTLPSVDLSDKVIAGTRTGNIEAFLFIPDNTIVSSVELRIGSSASAYYSYTFQTNYQESGFENGTNLVSIPWFLMTQVGAPNNNSISYARVIFNETTTAQTTQLFGVDAILWVDEDRVRNFPCIRTGNISIPGDYYNKNSAKYTVQLLNYTGYALSTHTINLVSQANIATLKNTQTLNLEGSMNLLPELNYTLNGVTNLSQLKISNDTIGEFIYFSNTWVANDRLKIDNLNKKVTRNDAPQDFTGGKLLQFKPGINKLTTEVIQASNSTIEQLVYNASDILSASGPIFQAAQSFTTIGSGTLTQLTLWLKGYDAGAGFGQGLRIQIVNDNADNPGSTILFNQVFKPAVVNSFEQRFDFPILASVAAATKYWIQLSVVGSNQYTPHYNSSGGLAGGARKTFNGSAWSANSGDYAFILTVAPTPSTSYNLDIKYKKLYI